MQYIAKLDKLCPQCGETKPVDAFYIRNKTTGAPYSWCKACRSKRKKREWREMQGLPRFSPKERELRRAGKARHQQSLKDMVSEIKIRRGCVDCGYRDHAEALHFDHLPGEEKKGKVCDIRRNGSIELLLVEMAKCEVVCANCHAIRTAKRNGRL